MAIGQQFVTNVPTWYGQQQLPNPEDYADDASYQQALSDYVTMVNGTDPVFAPPTVNGVPVDVLANPQWKQDLKPGDWRTAGSTNRTVAGQTPGEFYSGALQRIALDDTPGVGGYIGIQRWAQNHPAEAQAAYNAIRTDGTPVLPDPVLAMLEQAGLKVTGSTPGTTDPGEIADNKARNDALRPRAGTTKPAPTDVSRFRPVAGTTKPPLVRAEDGSMVPPSFYAGDPVTQQMAPTGNANFNDALAALGAMQQAGGNLDPGFSASDDVINRIRARYGRAQRYGY